LSVVSGGQGRAFGARKCNNLEMPATSLLGAKRTLRRALATGRQDSSLRMAESKSNKFHLSLQAHSEKSGGNPGVIAVNNLIAVSE
jgi:hypothetical protein